MSQVVPTTAADASDYMPTSPMQALRNQLPERLRDTYMIKLRSDAFGLRCVALFAHIKTDQILEVPLNPGLCIPDASLSLLCLAD